MRNKIAVIMSIYKNDRIKFVKLAVESILNQTCKNLDYYILYDGPVDAEVETYLSGLNDERIKIRRRAENKGLAQSLNELLNIVMPMGYEYIARMDADDISEQHRFERQLLYFKRHPEIECLGTWATEITNSGDEYFKKEMPESHEDCKKLFHKRDCMIHPTVMFHRAYIEKAGFYDINTFFGEDTMMWAQGFAAGCKMGNVPEYLFRFRLDNNFFERRRGWKHAKSIFMLRHRVNKLLRFGIKEDIYALCYAIVKIMPKSILNYIYRIAR